MNPWPRGNYFATSRYLKLGLTKSENSSNCEAWPHQEAMFPNCILGPGIDQWRNPALADPPLCFYLKWRKWVQNSIWWGHCVYFLSLVIISSQKQIPGAGKPANFRQSYCSRWACIYALLRPARGHPYSSLTQHSNTLLFLLPWLSSSISRSQADHTAIMQLSNAFIVVSVACGWVSLIL